VAAFGFSFCYLLAFWSGRFQLGGFFFFLEGSGKRIPEISFYFFMSANVLLIAQLLSIQCCRDQESVYTYADALVHVRLLDVEGNILHWSSES